MLDLSHIYFTLGHSVLSIYQPDIPPSDMDKYQRYQLFVGWWIFTHLYQ